MGEAKSHGLSGNLFGPQDAGRIEPGVAGRRAAKQRLATNSVSIRCKMCKRKLLETPSCFFVCPWCQTKLYDPIDIVSMAGLERPFWEETAPNLDTKVELGVVPLWEEDKDDKQN